MLIEIRIGPGKEKLVSSILNVKHKCRIHSSKIHRVPHITLYGSFVADYGQVHKVKKIIESVGRKYSFLPYTIDGFGWIKAQKGKVIYFNIVPSKELKEFRKELAEKLLNVVPLTKPFDKKEGFLFHTTLAYKLSDAEFDRIWSFVSGNKWFSHQSKRLFTGSEDYAMRYFYLPMYALRVTFLNDKSKIICEYDFLQKRLLSRREALDRKIWQKTLKLFRLKRGMENCKDDKKSIYLISDLHLDHANIIRYCARPFLFSDVEEMNRVLVDNWNNVVKDNTIFFLGDLSFGKGSRPAEYWLKKLKGDIHFIRGNHETSVKNSKDYEILEYKNYKFLLIHDPDNLPIKWSGWIIHGDKHNNDMKNYPFINGEKKTINVSAELLNYKPIDLDFIISLKLDSIKRMDLVDSKPKRR
ncbi:MAG: 2'-5' RNA ligase family protein [Candidatus Aenigmatarchaeota archaeon]|jgi:calcineurin-like phosphoesterase family protein/2'-5' RNA ligase